MNFKKSTVLFHVNYSRTIPLLHNKNNCNAQLNLNCSTKMTGQWSIHQLRCTASDSLWSLVLNIYSLSIIVTNFFKISLTSLSTFPLWFTNSIEAPSVHIKVFLLPLENISSKSYLLFVTFLTITRVLSVRVKRTGFAFVILILSQTLCSSLKHAAKQ